MAGVKVVLFFVLISLMIFLTHQKKPLSVILTNGVGPEYYESEIKFKTDEHKRKVYDGVAVPGAYWIGPTTSKVIVYIKRYSGMEKTLRGKCSIIRKDISKELIKRHYELLYLGVKNFNIYDDPPLIANFLLQMIQCNPNLFPHHFEIVTLGVQDTDIAYKSPTHELKNYIEEDNIYRGNLRQKLGILDK